MSRKYKSGITKKSYQQFDGTQYFTVLDLALTLQNIPNAKITTVMIFCILVKQIVPGYCYAQDGE